MGFLRNYRRADRILQLFLLRRDIDATINAAALFLAIIGPNGINLFTVMKYNKVVERQQSFSVSSVMFKRSIFWENVQKFSQEIHEQCTVQQPAYSSRTRQKTWICVIFMLLIYAHTHFQFALQKSRLINNDWLFSQRAFVWPRLDGAFYCSIQPLLHCCKQILRSS